MVSDRMPEGQETSFYFFRASDYPRVTQAYVDLKEQVISLHPWAIFNFTASDLVLRDARIGVILNGKQPVSGLHAIIDGANVAHIQGVVVHEGERGKDLGPRTVRASLVRLHRDLGIQTAELTIRVRADGKRNEAAFRAFSAAGFQEVGPITAQWSGLFCDIHLKDTCEVDSSGKLFISGVLMRANLSVLFGRTGGTL